MSLSSSEALNKMKKKLNRQGLKQQLRPVAKGAPQFMLGLAEGRTRPLLHLYDTGCGSVLFKTGVPEKELKGCVLKTKGPFQVGGVGGTSVKVNDEFMVTISLADNTRQICEGWTIDRITDALPFVDLRQAERDLKSSDPDNVELQQLQCPPQIGGEVDVLMGILYSNIFPRPVHSLSNGLTIYEMRVTPHDPQLNAVIGGPHSSFRFMAQDIGGIAILFANLSQQLENYKNYGPPQIGKALMSEEDFRFAKKFMEWGDESLDQHIQEFNKDDDNAEEIKFLEKNVLNDAGEGNSHHKRICMRSLGGAAVANDALITLSSNKKRSFALIILHFLP